MALRASDGTLHFVNSGNPPIGWTAEVTENGDVLTTMAGEIYRWDRDHQCYICHDPLDGADTKYLYLYENMMFGIVGLPAGPVSVGVWS